MKADVGRGTIKVEFTEQFKDITKKSIMTMEISENTTIKDVIERLIEQYGQQFRDRVYTGNGLNELSMIMHNAKIIGTVEQLSIKVSSGDRLAFMKTIQC